MSNVFRLPTAPKRRVPQPAYNNAAGRAAIRALKEADPWPDVHKLPATREMERKEAYQRNAIAWLADGTASQLIALAIYAALDEETQTKVRKSLAPRSAFGEPTFKRAMEVMAYSLPVLEREIESFETIASMSRRRDGDDAA